MTRPALCLGACLLLAARIFPGDPSSSPAWAGTTEVVTVAVTPSTEPAPASECPSISGDGRYVAFYSTAPNLVAEDTNSMRDVFVYDRQTGTTTRVSVDSAGVQGNDWSSAASISEDGRYVAFWSYATNLVAGDSNGFDDVFVHDRQTGTTTTVSIDSAGTQGNNSSRVPALSGDGRYVAFYSSATNLVPGDTNGRYDVFVHDRLMSTTTRVSVDSAGAEGNSDSTSPSISADGRYVAFWSGATNLVAGDTNGRYDAFVHDRQSGTTTRVSVDSAGIQGNRDSYTPELSADGRYVAFPSEASNLVVGDTNARIDAFVHDRQTGTTTRVSVDSAGAQANNESLLPSLSGDGRYVAFASYASNLVSGDTNLSNDVFIHDRQTATTTRVSVDSAGIQGNFGSNRPSISGDGRYVAFYSYASNLVAEDTNHGNDVFVHDRQSGSTERTPDTAQPPPAGALLLADGASEASHRSLSADGRYVAFSSEASNLVAGDTNSTWDVFVRDRQAGTTTRVSVDSTGIQANNSSHSPALSGDGRYVAFHSYASNLVAGDANGSADVFVHDRLTSTTTRVSVDSAGLEVNSDSYSPSISGDGRYVAFYSYATNLVVGDTNWRHDVFVHDRQTGTTTRVSVDSMAVEGNSDSYSPSISEDGRYVAFSSDAWNLVFHDENASEDVFVRDRLLGKTARVSVIAPEYPEDPEVQGDSDSYNPSISGDGRYVAFESLATNLVAGDTNGKTDVFVRDRETTTPTRVSVDSAGIQGNSDSYLPSISGDGRYVAFESNASNLVAGDTNVSQDVFIHDLQSGATRRASLDSDGVQANGGSYSPAISGNGGFVAFISAASNLVPGGDFNGIVDVFVRDMAALFSDGFESGDPSAWSASAP